MEINIRTKILYVVATLLLWLLCYTCTAQTKREAFAVDSIPFLTPDTVLNQFIFHWLGKPYKLGGKTEKGIDCSQFNKRLHLDVYKINLENVCYRQWDQTERIKQDSLKVGDLVFFRSRQSPSGWHCGTYIGNTMFVHAANRYEGVKISSLLEPNYKKAYLGAGKLPQN